MVFSDFEDNYYQAFKAINDLPNIEVKSISKRLKYKSKNHLKKCAAIAKSIATEFETNKYNHTNFEEFLQDWINYESYT